jgi:hypothetical protein
MNKTTSVAAERAAGASAGAWQQNPAICSKVGELIRDLRADRYLAIHMDEFVGWVNERLRLDAEEGRGVFVKATADDVKKCIRYDATVKVVKAKDAEVLWLWESWSYYDLVRAVAEIAAVTRAALVAPEDADEYGGDCGMLGCDKGDNNAQMSYFEE